MRKLRPDPAQNWQSIVQKYQDPRELQLLSAAKRTANAPSRQIDRQIAKLAAKAPELTEAQFDALAAIVRRRSNAGNRE
jgi:hypothetical protein